MTLDTFASIVGVHPLHFNQVEFNGVGGCGRVWLQYDWQGPTAVSRESVARAISSAEDLLEEYLGFATKPKWYEDWILPLEGNPLVLPRAHYISGGRKTIDLIEAGVTVTFSDEDLDGYDETATISVATSVTDPDEIVVYYPDENSDWQIPTKSITITNGTATIKIAREDLVKKELLEALHPNAVDGTTDASFYDAVDIYRQWSDPSTQCYLRHRDYNCCSGITGCEACTFTEQSACLHSSDRKSSIVNITRADWSTDHFDPVYCNSYTYYAARTSFIAGWTGSPIWDQAIAYLALTQLDAGLCECPTVQKRMDYWTTDLGKSDRTQNYKIPKALDQCPWGYQRGALFAYSIAQKHKMPQGMV